MRLYEIEKVINGYNGYLLSEKDRNKLLKKFPPKYPDVILHHCTVKFPAYSNDQLPTGKTFAVVGYCNAEKGLECLIIEIDGSVHRADGSINHITLSIDKSKGIKPVHSNEAIKKFGYDPITPIKIDMTPKFFGFDK